MTVQGSYSQLVDYVRRRAKDIAYQEPSLELGIAKFRELVLAEAAEDFFSKQKHSVLDNKTLDMSNPVANTPLNPHPRLSMTTPEFVAKLEKYAQTVPSEVAGYIRNIPVWLEQEETKVKAAIAYLVSEGHTISKNGAVVASPAQAPVTPPVVA